MKSRIFWLAVVIAAIAGFYYSTIRPALAPTPPRLNRRIMKEFRPEALPVPPIPAPVVEMPTLAPPLLPAPTLPPPVPHGSAIQPLEVPIQNGATIDFSIGAPVVRSQGGDQAALEQALKEMSEAVKDVTFEPQPPKDSGAAGK